MTMARIQTARGRSLRERSRARSISRSSSTESRIRLVGLRFTAPRLLRREAVENEFLRKIP